MDNFFFFFSEIFEEICIEVLEYYFISVKQNEKINIEGREYEVDAICFDDMGYRNVIEIKHYSVSRIDFSLIERACKRTKVVSGNIEAHNSYIITNIKVDDYFKETVLKEYGVILVDVENLLYLVREFPDLKARLFNALELKSDNDRDLKESEFSFSQHAEFSELIKPVINFGKELSFASKLKKIRAGRKHSQDYEKLMTEILKELFQTDVIGWHCQCSTDDGLHRYDLICRISNEESIWKIFVHDFTSRYVLFEFKNYSTAITQQEVFSTEKYLFKTAKRSVGFIISRKGPSDNAKVATDGILRETGKLLIHLCDHDIVKMIQMYEEGSDPRDYLLCKLDEILMKLAK